MTRLLSVISVHGLSDKVGIRLLHKHNEIYPDEIMAEDYVIDSNGLGLITKATKISHLSERYVPNSWMLRGNSYIPVEFSEKSLWRMLI